MTPPRLATYSVGGSTKYGAVTDDGIVDLSARFGKEYPTLREVDRRRRTDKTGRGCRAALSRIMRSMPITWLPPIPAPEKIICIGVNYPDRNAEYKDGSGRAEISEHVHAHAALLCRPQHAAGAPARIAAARLRGRSGARHRQGRPAYRRERGARSHRGGHAVQRRHHPRLGAARQIQRHAGQEFRLHRQPRPMARSLHRRSADRRHQADDAGQWRDAAGRPHLAADLRLPLPDQLHLDLHDAGARRRHRHGNADRRRRAVRSAALPETRRRRRGRGRQYRRVAQRRDRRSLRNRSRAIGPCHDLQYRRRSHRQRPGRARRRHRVRAARRADLRPVRRVPAGAAEGDRRAPRAGLRLHGLWLCAIERQTRRVQRGARPRRAQRRRGDADRVRLERAGAVPDRTGADAISRQGPRPSARNAGPARDAANLREMGRAHRISRTTRRRWSRARSRKCCRGGAARWRWKCRGTCSRKRAEVGAAKAVRSAFRRRSPIPIAIKAAAALVAGQQDADDLRRQRRDRRAR